MKDYIIDDGRVRMCDSNIAKMNIAEYMWYMRYKLWGKIEDAWKQFLDNWEIFVNPILIIILPIYYPYMAIMHIRHAKKVVTEYAMAKDSETPP